MVMEIKIISGKENFQVFKRMSVLEKQIEAATRKGFRRYGNTLMRVAEEDVKDKASKTGRWYDVMVGWQGQKLQRKRRHRSSGFFQTHANLSGDLLRSMGWVLSGGTINYGYGASGDPVPEYAEFVEFIGGEEELPNRPTLQNTIEKTEVDAINFLENAFDDAGLKF